MTADDYTTLMDFLAKRFARMDARFDAIEARQDALEARLTRSEVLWESMRDDIRRVAEGVMAVNERLDRFRVETLERFAEHDRRFDQIDARFAEHDRRFDQVDARFDQIDARLAEHDRRLEGLDRGVGGLQVHFDRFAVDFGTVRLDHGSRIEALERRRRRRGPGG
jgi:chromosome segregation ATPase